MNGNLNRGNTRKEKKKMNVITKTTSAAVLVTLDLVLTARTAELADILRDKFAVPPSECRGWGRWETPTVWANHGAQVVPVMGGAVTIPPASIEDAQQ